LSTTPTTSTHDEMEQPADAQSDAEIGRRHEVFGIVTGAATLLLLLSLWSYDAQGGENWIGPVGAGLAAVVAAAFGIGAWLLPVELGLLSFRLFTRQASVLGIARAVSTLVIVLVGCALLHLSLHDVVVFGGHLAGGVLGEVCGEVLRSLLGLAGAYVVGLAVLLVTLVLRTSISVVAVARWLGLGTQRAGTSLWGALRAIWEAWREARELERAELAAREAALQPRIVSDVPPAPGTTLPGTVTAPRTASKAGAAAPQNSADSIAYEDESDADEPDADDDAHLAGEDTLDRTDDDATDDDATDDDAIDDDDAAVAATPVAGAPAPKTPRTASAAKEAKVEAPREKVARAPAQPAIIPPTPAAPPPAQARSASSAEPAERIVPGAGRGFVLPPTTLLAPVPEEQIVIDEKTLRDNAARLVDKLNAYGVQGRVDEIHPGPVVTMYELEPASGTKVSKIASLADDLAMALAAQKVRIVAPIPGKARVGFELPNKHRQSVSLREILEDARWRDTKSSLPMALGKDIAGQPVYVDMAKMPHLLVAGATGAGKSVGLNVMLASMLSRRTPEEVRMLMIDPKVVELAVFDGIPHMLLPVVTDMKKASLALRWAVDEMERRYQLFADAGAKNIGTYNERVEKVLRGEMHVDKLAPKKAGKVRAQTIDGEEVYLPPDDGEVADANAQPPTKLPFIVVVVDEFADLMMVAAKDVESAVARLAQKARAAGIHVILATQRPSVDVITGMIKANFPARIAFKVAQRQDSQTILGQNGAEHLLGMGDMLMIPPGAAELKRVHCAFISEDEVQAVCDFLRMQGKPVYDENILKPRDEDGEGAGGEGGDGDGPKSDDPLYDKAVALVAQAGYCSISHIQRHLSVGYNKAAKLVERMEKDGIVGAASAKAGGRREVLVQPM
jgi:S-DNA-T family DNA segregation ATPase FtsK/SpoIIIE